MNSPSGQPPRLNLELPLPNIELSPLSSPSVISSTTPPGGPLNFPSSPLPVPSPSSALSSSSSSSSSSKPTSGLKFYNHAFSQQDSHPYQHPHQHPLQIHLHNPHNGLIANYPPVRGHSLKSPHLLSVPLSPGSANGCHQNPTLESVAHRRSHKNNHNHNHPISSFRLSDLNMQFGSASAAQGPHSNTNINSPASNGSTMTSPPINGGGGINGANVLETVESAGSSGSGSSNYFSYNSNGQKNNYKLFNEAAALNNNNNNNNNHDGNIWNNVPENPCTNTGLPSPSLVLPHDLAIEAAGGPFPSHPYPHPPPLSPHTTTTSIGMSLAMNLASSMSPARRISISSTSSGATVNFGSDPLEFMDTISMPSKAQQPHHHHNHHHHHHHHQGSPRSDSFFAKSILTRGPSGVNFSNANISSRNGSRSNSDVSLHSIRSINSGNSYHSDHIAASSSIEPSFMSRRNDHNMGNGLMHQSVNFNTNSSLGPETNMNGSPDMYPDDLHASRGSVDYLNSSEYPPASGMLRNLSCDQLEIPGFKDLRPMTKYALDYHSFQSNTHSSSLSQQQQQHFQNSDLGLPEWESDIGFYRATEIETNEPKIIKFLNQVFDPYLPEATTLVSSYPDSTSASNPATATASGMGIGGSIEINSVLGSQLDEPIDNEIVDYSDDLLDGFSPVSSTFASESTSTSFTTSTGSVSSMLGGSARLLEYRPPVENSPSMEILTQITAEWLFLNEKSTMASYRSQIFGTNAGTSPPFENNDSNQTRNSTKFKYVDTARLINRSKLIPGCLRPVSYVWVSENPSNYALVYNDDIGLKSLYEVFLADSRSSLKTRTGSTTAGGTTAAAAAAAASSASASASTAAEPKTNAEVVRILKCIINILKTLVQAHRARITHNALSTAGIFIDADDNTHIGYWDFSFALRSEDPCRGYRRKNIRNMSFCLPYISPEATGLMNRFVDFRADLYAVGCILYELLLGFPPFRSNDPQDLCTMHVVSQPLAPALAAPWIPPSLSDLILKLLEKCACDRYQCAEQVICHLNIIIDALEIGDARGPMAPLLPKFIPKAVSSKGILKSFDSVQISSQFLVPQLIFGRDRELTMMKQLYETISNKTGSSFQLLVLKGNPGTGKTRLILEMEKFFISKHGFFSIAKFDKYSRDPPFFTLIKVLQDLVHQVLSGSQSKIQIWRETILSSIKTNLDMLFVYIPELKELLGPTYVSWITNSASTNPGIGPVKREMRLKLVVKSLFCLFGTYGLTVFLDDIQWSSQEEFNFFQDLRSFADDNGFVDTNITFTCAAISSIIPESALSSSSASSREARQLAIKCESLLKPFMNSPDFLYQEIELPNLTHDDVYDFLATMLWMPYTKPVRLIPNQQPDKLADTNIAPIPVSSSSTMQNLNNERPFKQVAFRSRSVSPMTVSPPSQSLTFSVITNASHSTDQDSSSRDNINNNNNDDSDSGIDSNFESLANFIYNQTQGNALFLNIMVRYLYHFNFIYFHGTSGEWKINSHKFEIEKSQFPKTVEEAIVRILNILPPRIVQLLKYAACICSNSFNLEDLAISVGLSFGTVNESLYSATDLGLIVPLSIHYKYCFGRAKKTIKIKKLERSKIARTSSFKFYHDIVQQAIRSTLSESEEEQIHRIIGMRLLRSHNLKFMPKQKVLEIANQLRLAVDIAKKDDYENSIYRDVNIKAGKFVYAISDFVMAYNYFNIARLFLPEDCWSTDNPELLVITKEIHISLIELQYLKREFEPCLELIDYTLRNSGQNDILSRVRCLKIKIKVLSRLGRRDEAISVAFSALSLLGLDFDETGSWMTEKISPNIPLSVTEIRELAKLPVTTDPKTVLIHELLVSIILITFFSDRQKLLHHITLIAVDTCIRLGSCPICSYAFIALGALFQTDGDRINLTRAYEYSKLAIMALESETTLEMDFGINIYDFYTLTLASFHEPFSEITRYYDIVASSGLQPYDNDANVTLSVALRPMCQFLSGECIHVVLSEFSRCRFLFTSNQDSSANYKTNVSLDYVDMVCQFLKVISGDISMGTMDNIENLFPETNKYPALANVVEAPFESSDRLSVEVAYGYYICRLILGVLFNDRSMSKDTMLYKLQPLISKIPVTIYHQFVVFYGSLALLDMPDREESQSEMLNQFAQTLSDWAAMPANNVRHKHLLIQAELNKDKINNISLLDAYEEAAKLAADQGYVHDAAIINERCGDWVLTQSRNRGLSYFQEACRLYRQWGSQKKVQQLCSKYPELSDSTSIFDMSRMSVSNSEVSSNGRIHILPASFNSKLGQANTSPLRWILSNLFNEDRQMDTELPDESGLVRSKKPSRNKSIRGLNDDPIYNNIPRNSFDNNLNSPESLGSKFPSVIESTNDYLKPALQVCLEISESIDVETIILRLMQSVITLGGWDYSTFISLDDAGGLYLESVGTFSGVSILRHEPLSSRTDLAPISVIQAVLATGQPLIRDNNPRLFDTLYGRDPYYANRIVPLHFVLCVPIQNHLKTIGLLYMENQRSDFEFTASKMDFVTLLASQSAVSIEKAKIYKQMDLAKKAAEEATAEKASFLANMSHEIRTPFNALLSCSIFLLDTDLQDIQREYVETIRSSSMLTLDIIDAILAFSKIEHGSINLDNSPFSLRECVESAVQLVAEPAAAKDLELVHIYRSGAIDTVYGDVTRFRQIIINLVGNAVKFTPSGHIIVETRSEKLSADNRYEVVISVTDTGIGIPKDSRNKVFRAFSQVDGSSRRVYGGTGLGLAISKKLAELMGGTLTFESVEGKSTVFRFATVVKIDPPKPDRNIEVYKDKVCIICDFSPISKTALKLDLLTLGFKIVECEAENILDLIQSSPPDTYSIVFVDYRKVDLKSKRAIRIRSHDPKLHQVLMTHFGAPFPYENIRQLGFSAILLRPYQQTRLVNVIKQVLEMANSDEDVKKDAEMLRDITSQKAGIDKGFIKSMAEHHPLKILLAEDNIINTRVALQHLKRMGYLDVHHAKDGVEVIEHCQRELSQGKPMYDVILMDIQMPRKDGIATAKEIRETYNEDLQPSIIALTANTGGDDKEKCLNAGMVSYLAKPILPPELAAVLMGVKPISSRKK